MPRLAPDLRRVVMAIGDGSGPLGSQGDLWIHDFDRDTRSRLTFDGISTFPALGPCRQPGHSELGQSGQFQILLKTFDGKGPDMSIPTERGTNYPLSWSPDGRFVATVSVETDTANNIWVLTPGTRPEWRPFVQTRFREGAPTFSHDGRLIAYPSDQ